MTDRYVLYKEGYKYQVYADCVLQTDIKPACDIVTDFITLLTDGTLIIKKGYAWDGASGPTWDDNTNMRGSLGHDALYQLMRMGLLDIKYRTTADALLRMWCIEDGMWSVRADAWFWSVQAFAKECAEKKKVRKVKIAPRAYNYILEGV